MSENAAENHAEHHKHPKRRGCLFKLIAFLIFVTLIVALALGGWYAYLKFIAGDDSVKDKDIITFSGEKLKWAGGQFASIFEMTKKGVVGDGATPKPPETGAEGNGTEQPPPPATGTATIKSVPANADQQLREEAERANQRGMEFFQRAADSGWRKDLLDKSEMELRIAIAKYNELKRKYPRDSSIDESLQDINRTLYDISKQRPLK